MNERIEQLAEQCWTHTNEPLFGAKSKSPHWEFDRHKFAELIVRECMRMCEVTEMSFETHGCSVEASGAITVKQFIADWFEVEE